MDMISKLPQGVIETILCLLPIQEAARTSMLSKEWRYRWIKIPKLAFIEDTFEGSRYGPESSALGQAFSEPSMRCHKERIAKTCKLFNAIYQVLLTHDSPILEFTLCMDRIDGPGVEIDYIILHLSKKNTIKRLKLDYGYTCDGYLLPTSFFSLHHLTDLYLKECAISHKRSFNEFGRMITTLYLEQIYTYEKTLLALLSSCPLLKRLTLINDDSESILYSQDSNIANLFECLPSIEYLSISCSIVMCFVPDKLPKVLPSSLVHLKYFCMLNMYDEFDDHKYEIPFLALLIRSSPNLEKLKLVMSPTNWDEEDENELDIVLEHLNELEINIWLRYPDSQLDFVKLIFAKSPALKQVTIFLCGEFDHEDELRASDFLLNTPCTSPVVQKLVFIRK